ncbi:DUF4406 domain-containing protein [Spirochaeta africana]|uniref:Nucleoside 2-deoxyribosyltransferase n=1 Tax=Spirochaeta africana (strain ATCC 700263 / DSM 8902 / Z-7692) TaxID=889378 RepID=H9UJF9_SPIAZ|nr:DUF4406 domain-containing protein [Spirochaeta africana]AFG37652.1 hypothetical protein Spiaf_1594 [Spirochaeta africana DSM 8902]
MIVYISGPITGKENGNSDAFSAAAEKLTAAGHTPINPHELQHDHDKSWESYMRVDIKALMDADAVLLLDGWNHSNGAHLENAIARAVGIPAYYPDMDPNPLFQSPEVTA